MYQNCTVCGVYLEIPVSEMTIMIMMHDNENHLQLLGLVVEPVDVDMP